MIFRLFVAVFVGLATHQLDKPVRLLGPRVGMLTKFSIGLLTFIPLFILIKQTMPKPANDTWLADAERDLTAGLMTAGAQGTGVFIGYALDSHE